MKALYSFDKDMLLHSGRLIVPLLLMIGYIGIAYAVAPLDILSSFSIGALVVFILSLSVGIMDAGLSSPMIEQAMWVKLPKKRLFFFSRAALMAAVALAFALLSTLAPLVLHLFNGSALFKRPVSLADMFSGFALFWLASYTGGMAGQFTSPRLIRDRRMAILLGAAFGVLTLVRGALKKAVWLVYLLWFLPPMYDLTTAYSADSVLVFSGVWPFFLWMAFYAAAETVLYVWVMTKRRFE
jgi:hypothetical protein